MKSGSGREVRRRKIETGEKTVFRPVDWSIIALNAKIDDVSCFFVFLRCKCASPGRNWRLRQRRFPLVFVGQSCAPAVMQRRKTEMSCRN
ncbi:MAG: hypothetical protein ACN6N0_02990 [Microvirgula sp.]